MIIQPSNEDGVTLHALTREAALEAATAVTADPGDVARVAEWLSQVCSPGVVARISYSAAGVLTLSYVDLDELDAGGAVAS